MEFQISYILGIPKNFNDYDFYEFLWWFERIAEERRKEEAAKQNQTQNPASMLENQRRTLE